MTPARGARAETSLLVIIDGYCRGLMHGGGSAAVVDGRGRADGELFRMQNGERQGAQIGKGGEISRKNRYPYISSTSDGRHGQLEFNLLL